jgi:hypothetical protein
MHCSCMIWPTRSVGIRLCLKGLEPASRCAIGTFKGSIMALANLASRFAGAEVPRNSQDGGMLDCKSMKSSDDFSDDLMNKCLFHIDCFIGFLWNPMDSRDISDFRCLKTTPLSGRGTRLPTAAHLPLGGWCRRSLGFGWTGGHTLPASDAVTAWCFRWECHRKRSSDSQDCMGGWGMSYGWVWLGMAAWAGITFNCAGMRWAYRVMCSHNREPQVLCGVPASSTSDFREQGSHLRCHGRWQQTHQTAKAMAIGQEDARRH